MTVTNAKSETTTFAYDRNQAGVAGQTDGYLKRSPGRSPPPPSSYRLRRVSGGVNQVTDSEGYSVGITYDAIGGVAAKTLNRVAMVHLPRRHLRGGATTTGWIRNGGRTGSGAGRKCSTTICGGSRGWSIRWIGSPSTMVRLRLAGSHHRSGRQPHRLDARRAAARHQKIYPDARREHHLRGGHEPGQEHRSTPRASAPTSSTTSTTR